MAYLKLIIRLKQPEINIAKQPQNLTIISEHTMLKIVISKTIFRIQLKFNFKANYPKTKRNIETASNCMNKEDNNNKKKINNVSNQIQL